MKLKFAEIIKLIIIHIYQLFKFKDSNNNMLYYYQSAFEFTREEKTNI